VTGNSAAPRRSVGGHESFATDANNPIYRRSLERSHLGLLHDLGGSIFIGVADVSIPPSNRGQLNPSAPLRENIAAKIECKESVAVFDLADA
jgi:hypothetical protein